jgi:hypothetical protein
MAYGSRDDVFEHQVSLTMATNLLFSEHVLEGLK